MARGRTKRGGRCACGFKYARFAANRAEGIPKDVRAALDRTNAIRHVGADSPYLGAQIQLAITENA